MLAEGALPADMLNNTLNMFKHFMDQHTHIYLILTHFFLHTLYFTPYLCLHTFKINTLLTEVCSMLEKSV